MLFQKQPQVRLSSLKMIQINLAFTGIIMEEAFVHCTLKSRGQQTRAWGNTNIKRCFLLMSVKNEFGFDRLRTSLHFLNSTSAQLLSRLWSAHVKTMSDRTDPRKVSITDRTAEQHKNPEEQVVLVSPAGAASKLWLMAIQLILLVWQIGL